VKRLNDLLMHDVEENSQKWDRASFIFMGWVPTRQW